MNKIRILSLDGGGTRAGVLARALGAIYRPETPGREIMRDFDYVVGNSGGSIVLTALCCNYTPAQIAGFYDDPSTLKRMFSPNWASRLPVLPWFFGGYSSKGKLEALKWIFDRNQQSGEPLPSQIRLNDWPRYLGHKVDLIVAAFDYDQERATFFRSNPESRAKSSARAIDATLVEAVHASTNAPLPYYDKPAIVGRHRYWDGALAGHNNPVLAAVVEALANHPGESDNVRVLSIGTGGSVQPLARDGAEPPLGKAREGTGAFTSLRKAGTAVFADPPDVATFHAHVALRQPMPERSSGPTQGNVVRFCPVVRPIWKPERGLWDLPRGFSESEFESFVRMRLDPMSKADLALISKMSAAWIADEIPNQPIRMGDHMQCDIGHDTFSQARAYWQSIA